MRIFFTASLWFLATWVMFEIACFALGTPRDATPFAATSVGIVAGGLLAIRRARGATSSATLRPSDPL
jgi:hypothetical protein